jgi:hypothetical protein
LRFSRDFLKGIFNFKTTLYPSSLFGSFFSHLRTLPLFGEAPKKKELKILNIVVVVVGAVDKWITRFFVVLDEISYPQWGCG